MVAGIILDCPLLILLVFVPVTVRICRNIRKDSAPCSMASRSFSREELLSQCYQNSEAVIDRVIDVHIGKLRQKIEDDPADPSHVVPTRGVVVVGDVAEWAGKDFDVIVVSIDPTETPELAAVPQVIGKAFGGPGSASTRRQ